MLCFRERAGIVSWAARGFSAQSRKLPLFSSPLASIFPPDWRGCGCPPAGLALSAHLETIPLGNAVHEMSDSQNQREQRFAAHHRIDKPSLFLQVLLLRLLLISLHHVNTRKHKSTRMTRTQGLWGLTDVLVLPRNMGLLVLSVLVFGTYNIAMILP